MRYACVLFLSVAGYGLCFAQSGKSFEKRFSEGNKLLLKNNFGGALQSFLQAYAIDTANANAEYKIGYCYSNEGKNDSAARYLQKAIQAVSKTYDAKSTSEKSAPAEAYYYLAISEQNTWHFAGAIKAFKTYKTYLPASDKQTLAQVNDHLAQCKTAHMYIMAPNNARVVNLGDSINTIYDDYNPVPQPDGAAIIFTSRRPLSPGNKSGAANHAHIYISYSRPDSSWKGAKLYGSTLNFCSDNVSLSLSPDGQSMLLLCNNGKNSSIYESHLGENDWEMPQKTASDVNLAGSQYGACLSTDGNTLYFVSDRPGGMGGKDIWRCIKLPNGNWGKAMNLGEPVNTPNDEESPFMHADGKTFFFSSKGHNSMGGYDIFFSQLDDSGKYSEPFNLGYPINTPANELHFTISGDGKTGYMSSDRSGGKGGMDIYFVTMPHEEEKPLTVIRGQVTASPGETLSDDIHIIATDNATNEEVGDFKPMKTTGKFTLVVLPGRSYTLSYQDDDKEFYKEVINVPADAGYNTIHKELTLSPHSVGESVNGTAKPDGQ